MTLREDMSNRELLDLMIEEGLIREIEGLSINKRFNTMLRVCKHLGIAPNVEQKFFLMNDNRIVQCDATAGAGKTTMMMLKCLLAIGFGLESARSMCIITFSRDAVSDMKFRMKQMLWAINVELAKVGKKVDELPVIRSINSLSFNIVKQFATKFNLYNPTVPDSSVMGDHMRKAIKVAINQGFLSSVDDSLASDILRLYDYMNETMYSIDELATDSRFTELKMSADVLLYILKEFTSNLRLDDKVLHSECTRLVVDRVGIDKEFADFILNLYDYIVIDEFQDVSESMYQMIKLLATHARLLAIGDGDQAIYEFRGSRANNCERFAQEFDDSSLCLMTYNRRCRDEIIEFATTVLSFIENRIPKSIKGTGPGGAVTSYEYSDKVAVLEDLGKRLSKVATKDLSEICIAYRNNFTCYYITNIFTEMGIPFSVREEYMIGNDMLSVQLDKVLDMLKNPKSIQRMVSNLYKVCGISKVQKYEKGKNVTDEFIEDLMDEEDIDFLYELPASKLKLRGKLGIVEEELKILKSICKDLRTGKNMSEIIPRLMPLFRRNYWTYYMTTHNYPEDLENLVLKKYLVDMSYVEFRDVRQEREKTIKRYTDRGEGVQLSTFHSFKGLEYNEVHLLEIAEGVFPSIHVDDTTTDEEYAEGLSTELRLFYVAATRARYSLNMYFDISKPSAFYTVWETYKNRVPKHGTEAIKEVVDISISPVNIDEFTYTGDDLKLDIDLNMSDDDTGLDLTLFDDSSNESDTNDNLDDLMLTIDLDGDATEDIVSNESSDGADEESSESEADVFLSDTLVGTDVEEHKYESEPKPKSSELISSVRDNLDIMVTQAKKQAEESFLSTAKTARVFDDYTDEYESKRKELLTDLNSDFVDIENGDVLGNILSLICEEVSV